MSNVAEEGLSDCVDIFVGNYTVTRVQLSANGLKDSLLEQLAFLRGQKCLLFVFFLSFLRFLSFSLSLSFFSLTFLYISLLLIIDFQIRSATGRCSSYFRWRARIPKSILLLLRLLLYLGVVTHCFCFLHLSHSHLPFVFSFILDLMRHILKLLCRLL